MWPKSGQRFSSALKLQVQLGYGCKTQAAEMQFSMLSQPKPQKDPPKT